MGESIERDGVFGKYTEHRDDDGNKIGESREREGVFGKYIEHTDTDGNTIGESRDREGFFGAYREHTDKSGSKTGESREREGFFGDYTEHSNKSGQKTGESREREGFFGPYAEHTGSGWRGGPKESYAVPSSSSSDNGCAGVVVALIAVIAIVFVIIWLAVNVVLPILLLNSALGLTILAVYFSGRRTLLAALSLLGGGYFLFDVIAGGLSAIFVNNVVGDPIWITIFAYVNAIAVGSSTWFLVKPLWANGLAIKESDRNRSIALVGGSIALVGAALVSVPLAYHLIPNRLGISNNSSYSGTPENRPGPATSRPGTDPNGPTSTNFDTRLLTNFNRNYAGSINGISFSMSLVRNETKLEGQASTPSKTDTLTGTIDSNGNFEMKGYENGKKYTGIYKGAIDSRGSINGTWTRPNGTKETSFYVSQSQ